MRFLIDSGCMAAYLLLVYVWGLTVHPLGRDYAHMAAQGAKLPLLAKSIFAWELQTFGVSPVGYHVVNLILLYACMQCVYHLTQSVVRGPVWLGTLAATLFMANPVHTESVLNLSGVGDLVPCLAALLALALFAAGRRAEPALITELWPAAFLLAVLYPQNAFLIVALVCVVTFTDEPERPQSLGFLLPGLMMTILAAFLHRSWLHWEAWRPDRMFAPLYFIFYPIGFLPENAVRFAASPWLGWLAAAVVLALVVLLQRKVRRGAVWFGVISMLGVRLAQGKAGIDPVHLIGGGRLLLANAFFVIAAVAVFHRMMDHPKWRRPVVMLTTWLCVAFFVLQIRAEFAWRDAGARVRAFQQQAAAAQAEFGILPDIRYYRGAPMCLSESVAYDTPFSRKCSGIPLLTLDAFESLAKPAWQVEEWTPDGGLVLLDGAKPEYLLAAPYELARIGGVQSNGRARAERVAGSGDAWHIRITPGGDAKLPAACLSVNAPVTGK